MTGRRAAQSRLRIVDAFREAMRGVGRQPFRTLVPASAIVVGIATAVAASGIQSTSSAVLATDLAAARAHTVVVGAGSGPVTLDPFTPAIVDALLALPGVSTVGERWSADQPVAVSATGTGPVQKAQLEAATGGAVRPLIVGGSGRAFGNFASSRAEPVAIASPGLARRLGSFDLAQGPTVYVRGQPVTVMAVSGPSERTLEPGSGSGRRALIVPVSTMQQLLQGSAGTATRELVVRTLPGQTLAVARVLERTLTAMGVGELSVRSSGDEAGLTHIARHQSELGGVLAAMVMAAAFLSIFVTSAGTVSRRSSEIGLRRSLGARPGHIAGQVLLEATVVGAVAGVMGASIGAIVVTVNAGVHGVPPTLDLRLLVVGPVAGVLVAVLASLVPAVRAARIDPIVALRRD